jgi:hypothetical protein
MSMPIDACAIHGETKSTTPITGADPPHDLLDALYLTQIID